MIACRTDMFFNGIWTNKASGKDDLSLSNACKSLCTLLGRLPSDPRLDRLERDGWIFVAPALLMSLADKAAICCTSWGLNRPHAHSCCNHSAKAEGAWAGPWLLAAEFCSASVASSLCWWPPLRFLCVQRIQAPWHKVCKEEEHFGMLDSCHYIVDSLCPHCFYDYVHKDLCHFWPPSHCCEAKVCNFWLIGG